jgi:RND family efflux transporter MFP subunit
MEDQEKKSLLAKIWGKKWWVLVILILVGGGFGIWKLVIAKNGEVETAVIERGRVVEELILSGEIKADEHADLAFGSSGKIAWVGVSEGELVNEGQALMKLDTTNLNADLQRARSDLREEEATVDRVHDDVKDHDDDEDFETKETRTIAEVAKDKAWEAVIKAEENLRNATLIAPFAGLVTEVTNPFSGVNIIYTASQVELVNPETMYFAVSADQTEVVDLGLGQEVAIIFDAYPDEDFGGKIDYLSYTPKSDEVGTVYEVRVGFGDLTVDPNKFRVGMTGDAKFVLSEKEGVLWVPPKFVNSEREGKYVNLEKKNNKVSVEVGIEGEEMVEIVGDVKEGQVVYD